MRSSSYPTIAFRYLDPLEVPALAALEAAAWPVSLQAGEDVIRRRLKLGHLMLVAAVPDRLAAALCCIPTSELPFDDTRFPRDFGAFSSLPASNPVRSVYVYSLCVHPEYRGENIVRNLIYDGIARASAFGAEWAVGDGRCPSYAGAEDDGPDKVRADPIFKAAIDSWSATGRKPPLDSLIRDPTLRFYHRVVGCDFLRVCPNFLPQDTSSGGHRVIFIKNIPSAA